MPVNPAATVARPAPATATAPRANPTAASASSAAAAAAARAARPAAAASIFSDLALSRANWLSRALIFSEARAVSAPIWMSPEARFTLSPRSATSRPTFARASEALSIANKSNETERSATGRGHLLAQVTLGPLDLGGQGPELPQP